MEPEKLLEALHTAEKLKDTTRHCYTSKGRHESVAEHSWRIALMAFWLRDEFPQADMDSAKVPISNIHANFFFIILSSFLWDMPIFIVVISPRWGFLYYQTTTDVEKFQKKQFCFLFFFLYKPAGRRLYLQENTEMSPLHTQQNVRNYEYIKCRTPDPRLR